MELNLQSVLQLGSGFLWASAYWMIISQGFKDKITGMPLAALGANLAWEFIFAFIYPHAGLQGGIDKVWLALDVVILMQFIYYGRMEYNRWLPGRTFYITVLLVVALSFAIIMASVHEFHDWQGKYAAFGQNLMMSVLFVTMLLRRGSSIGQSIGIAWTKMIGSLLPALGFYFFYPSVLISTVTLGTLIFDIVYLKMMYRFKVPVVNDAASRYGCRT